jgi:hypothetical protein
MIRDGYEFTFEIFDGAEGKNDTEFVVKLLREAADEIEKTKDLEGELYDKGTMVASYGEGYVE